MVIATFDRKMSLDESFEDLCSIILVKVSYRDYDIKVQKKSDSEYEITVHARNVIEEPTLELKFSDITEIKDADGTHIFE